MIRALLFYRVDWCEAHPKLMAACATLCAFAALAVVGGPQP